MISADQSIDVNPDGTPDFLKLDREDVWNGLVRKAEFAPPYVKAITECRIIERDPTGFVREAVINGETLREQVVFDPMKTVTFDRLPGASAMGRIRNLIEEENGALKLRFTFDLEIQGATAEQEAEFSAIMERDYRAAVQTTLDRIRDERAQQQPA